MSVVAVSSNVLDAGSIPAISTSKRSYEIRKCPKTPEESGVFLFLSALYCPAKFFVQQEEKRKRRWQSFLLRFQVATVYRLLSRSGSLAVIDRFENLDIQYNEPPELVELVLHQESIEL